MLAQALVAYDANSSFFVCLAFYPAIAMTNFTYENENEIDYQYAGYVVRAKNTFIDVTPKTAQLRSRSCSAKFECYDLYNGSNVKGAPASPSTTCSSLSDDGDRDQQPVTRAYRRAEGLQNGYAAEDVDNEEFVAEQFQKYLVDTDNSGTTLMWHGLPTKYHMDPDLIRIIEAIDAKGVAYLYLPLNHWEKSRVSCGKCRNKGYAFLHFKTDADAQEFTRNVSEYTIESRRSTATTLAAHQGVSLNLTQLVTAPQKRTAAGSIYLPNAEGKFECVTIASLRKLHKAMGN
jgi:hypothetical protein